MRSQPLRGRTSAARSLLDRTSSAKQIVHGRQSLAPRACARKLHAILAGRRGRRRVRRPDGRPDVPAEPGAGHARAAALGRHAALPVDAVVGRPRAAAPAAAALRREHLPPGAADARLFRAPRRERRARRAVPAGDRQPGARPERRGPAVLRPVGSRDLPARAPARDLDRRRLRRRRDLRLRAAALHAPGAAPPRDRPVDSLLSRLRPRLSAAWTKARPAGRHRLLHASVRHERPRRPVPLPGAAGARPRTWSSRRRLPPVRTLVRDVGVAGVLLLAVNLPFLVPYFRVQRELGLRRTIGAVYDWVPNAASFLASPTHVDQALLSLVPPLARGRGRRQGLHVPRLAAAAARRRAAAAASCAEGRAVDARRDASRRLAAQAVARGGPGIGFYGLLAGLSLWASLGPPFGLYTALYKLLPGFDLIRVPSRLAILTLLAVAILAGAGADRLVERVRPGARVAAERAARAAAGGRVRAVPAQGSGLRDRGGGGGPLAGRDGRSRSSPPSCRSRRRRTPSARPATTRTTCCTRCCTGSRS